MSSGKAQMYEEEALEWIERLADPVDEATLIEAVSRVRLVLRWEVRGERGGVS